MQPRCRDLASPVVPGRLQRSSGGLWAVLGRGRRPSDPGRSAAGEGRWTVEEAIANAVPMGATAKGPNGKQGSHRGDDLACHGQVLVDVIDGQFGAVQAGIVRVVTGPSATAERTHDHTCGNQLVG